VGDIARRGKATAFSRHKEKKIQWGLKSGKVPGKREEFEG